jgi:hypothetical protein
MAGMTTSSFAAELSSTPESAAYEPGVCNIGPAEIARRRRAGHVGVLVTVGLLAALVLLDAHPLTRLALIVPATIAASGYLQAHLKFCAGYGQLGVFNFGPLGATQSVTDADALARDRRRARQIGLASFVAAVVVGLVAILLPI